MGLSISRSRRQLHDAFPEGGLVIGNQSMTNLSSVVLYLSLMKPLLFSIIHIYFDEL